MGEANRTEEARRFDVEGSQRGLLRMVARTVETGLNGGLTGEDRHIAFVLVAYPFGPEGEADVNFTSNHTDRAATARVLRAMVRRLEPEVISDAPSPDRIALAGGWYFEINPDLPMTGWLCDPEDGSVAHMTTDRARVLAKALAQPADDVAGLADLERLVDEVVEAYDIAGQNLARYGYGSDAQKNSYKPAVKAEGVLRATIATLRRHLADRDAEVDRWRKLAEVPDDLRALSEKLSGGELSSFENVVRDSSGADLMEGSLGHRNDDEDGADWADLFAGSINRLRAQCAATATADHGGRRG